MHRIDSSTKQVDKFGAGKHGWTEGEPGVTPATESTDDWFDGVQEEIANAIEKNGGTLAKGTRDQLHAAIGTPTATGTDDASHATAEDGHGVVAESDTSAPQKSALRIVPQDADPSVSPAMGDVYVHEATGKVMIYNGASWDRAIAQAYANPSASSAVTNTTTETAFDRSYTIPAGMLRNLSTVRIRAAARVTGYNSGSLALRLKLDGVTGFEIATLDYTPATDHEINFDIIAKIEGDSPTAGLHSRGTIVYGTLASPSIRLKGSLGFGSVTLAEWDAVVTAEWSVAHAGNSVRLDHFVIDIV